MFKNKTFTRVFSPSNLDEFSLAVEKLKSPATSAGVQEKKKEEFWQENGDQLNYLLNFLLPS